MNRRINMDINTDINIHKGILVDIHSGINSCGN